MATSTNIPAGRPWPRVKWTRASQLSALLEPTPELAAVQDLPPAAAFAHLRVANPRAAISFMAQGLPRIEAMRWAIACLSILPPPVSDSHANARLAVGAWLRDPSDKLRRLAFEAGAAVGWATTEGAACLAVFLSGGSMAPAEQEQPVNPAPGAFGQAVGGAVLLAALSYGPEHFDALVEQFLLVGDDIAAGEAPRAPRPPMWSQA